MGLWFMLRITEFGTQEMLSRRSGLQVLLGYVITYHKRKEKKIRKERKRYGDYVKFEIKKFMALFQTTS